NALLCCYFFFQAEDGIRDFHVTGVQTCALPISTNGGNNWNVQFQANVSFLALEFPDENTGYAGGGDGFPKLYKTTNKGLNWNLLDPPPMRVQDMQFINKDTGWICSDITIGGGVVKTTNGGINWELQLGQE